MTKDQIIKFSKNQMLREHVRNKKKEIIVIEILHRHSFKKINSFVFDILLI